MTYVSTESGRSEVYVSPFPNVTESRWQVSSNGGIYPAWAPDGRELFYLEGRAIMSVSIDTEPEFSWGEPEKLFEGNYVSGSFGFGRPYDVAPSGEQFLMMKPAGSVHEASAPEPRIVIVQNWFDELKRLVPTN